MNSGIYKIINLITKDFYIGSSCQLKRRQYVHFNQLINNKHKNSHLQNSYNKYGKDNFIFEIIEYCTNDILFQKEQYYIIELNPTYNILKNVGVSLGYKHTEKSIIKLKNQSKTYCSKKLFQYDVNNNFIKEWNSCSEFARFYNISRIAVIKAVKYSHKCKGFIVSYKQPTPASI